MPRPLVAALLLVLSAGCALGTEAVLDPGAARLAADGGLLSVDRDRYVPGDTAVVTLTNRLDEPLGFNLCFSAREIRTGSGWRRIGPLRICTAVLHRLGTGEQGRSIEPITEEWEAGTYRLVTRVERLDSGEPVEVFSGLFAVSR